MVLTSLPHPNHCRLRVNLLYAASSNGAAVPELPFSMGDASGSSSLHPSTLTLPSFHDFSAFARTPDPGAGPSRRHTHFDNQYFMSEVNAANGNGGLPYEDQTAPPPPMTGDPTFDILDWYPAYQSCQRYFLDISQHEPGTQALCALINIRLPFQHLTNPITSSTPTNHNNNAPDTRSPSGPGQPTNTSYQSSFPQLNQPTPGNLPSPSRSRASSAQPPSPFISLIPYIRRLTITGFDKPAILHGLFGDDYTRGILPHLDCERRNYLFAAKHGGWRTCKKQYDDGSGLGGGDETVPFMKPLDGASEEELKAAEKAWSRWLAMEDWMLGPDAVQEVEEREVGMEGQRTGRREEEMGGLPDGVGEAFERRRRLD